jgi:hypothetical protein
MNNVTSLVVLLGGNLLRTSLRIIQNFYNPAPDHFYQKPLYNFLFLISFRVSPLKILSPG